MCARSGTSKMASGGGTMGPPPKRMAIEPSASRRSDHQRESRVLGVRHPRRLAQMRAGRFWEHCRLNMPPPMEVRPGKWDWHRSFFFGIGNAQVSLLVSNSSLVAPCWHSQPAVWLCGTCFDLVIMPHLLDFRKFFIRRWPTRSSGRTASTIETPSVLNRQQNRVVLNLVAARTATRLAPSRIK